MNTEKKYKLSQVLNRQKLLIEDIKSNYSKLKMICSGKSFINYNKNALIVEQKNLREQLVKLKVIINKHNMSIYNDIFQLSELKTFLKELEMVNDDKFKGEIKYTEAEIARLEKSLKEYNESVQIPWFNLTGIDM